MLSLHLLSLLVLASFFSYCRWAASTWKVVPWIWEETGSLSPREEFWLAWPRSHAQDSSYSQGDEVGLCHLSREVTQTLPWKNCYKQTATAIFCFFKPYGILFQQLVKILSLIHGTCFKVFLLFFLSSSGLYAQLNFRFLFHFILRFHKNTG